MKELKEFSKRYLIGFLLSAIICTTISVYAATFASNDVTYNNKASGLKATNVKSAIDELYEKCTK